MPKVNQGIFQSNIDTPKPTHESDPFTRSEPWSVAMQTSNEKVPPIAWIDTSNIVIDNKKLLYSYHLIHGEENKKNNLSFDNFRHKVCGQLGVVLILEPIH